MLENNKFRLKKRFLEEALFLCLFTVTLWQSVCKAVIIPSKGVGDWATA